MSHIALVRTCARCGALETPSRRLVQLDTLNIAAPKPHTDLCQVYCVARRCLLQAARDELEARFLALDARSGRGRATNPAADRRFRANRQ